MFSCMNYLLLGSILTAISLFSLEGGGVMGGYSVHLLFGFGIVWSSYRNLREKKSGKSLDTFGVIGKLISGVIMVGSIAYMVTGCCVANYLTMCSCQLPQSDSIRKEIDSEVENSKSFLILNEIILKLKDAKDEAVREAAYDVLLKISVSLRDPSFVSSDGPYQKLINMIMGYLTGASPHIKSGAVSVLSVLVYKDTDICLSMPDLVPSILSLLQGKALEVIKAVLGFVKVLVSCLETRPLQQLLPDIVNAVLPWSPVSRHHFRSKVTVIMEILLRKCGTASVQFATPDKYKGFLKGIVESRHNKKSSKEVATTDIDTGHADTTTNRTEDKKRKRFGKPHEKNGSMEHREMKRLKRHIPNNQRTDELHTSGGDGFKRTNKGRQSDGVKSNKDQSERSGKTNKEKYSKGPASGFKRKTDSTNTRKDAAAMPRPHTSSKSFKHKKVGRKN